NTWSNQTPERQAWRQEQIDAYYGTGAPRKERQAFLVIGTPAAGKSSAIVRRIVAEHGAMVIDSDDFKERIPEFDRGLNAEGVHVESAELAARTLERAIAAGDNIVLPLVGKNPRTIQHHIDMLAGAGYTVELHLVELPTDKAQGRAVMRF